MIELAGVSASYRKVPAIRDIDIRVGEGEAVGLLGANGAGKSTTLRAISGLVKLTAGRITFEGNDLAALSPYRIAELGIAHVPEGRQVFPEMTAQENLEMGSFAPRAKAQRAQSLELVYAVFPRLAERRSQLAGTMSGGEQQMLALARTYVQHPKVVLLDEVSMGLAPKIVDEIFDYLRRLAERGPALLLVEQYATRALELADYVYVLQKGRISFAGEPSELDNRAIMASYLGAAP